MIEAVFFDFGGVLLQHADGIDHHAIEERLGLPERTVFNTLYRDSRYAEFAVGDCSADEWETSVREAAERNAGEQAEAMLKALQAADNDLNPDMVRLVQSLHGRYRLGIISNTTPGLEERLREQFPEIHRYFDVRIGSGDVGLSKPDPRIFQHATESMGVEPERSVFTDDVKTYAEAASALGMRGIHFTGYEDLARELRTLGVEW